jgi:SlyX protein
VGGVPAAPLVGVSLPEQEVGTVPEIDEDRIIELETKLAHQEHLLGELNDVLTDQQALITALELRCESLLGRISALGDGGQSGSEIDERPPHY